ncbi:MAG: DUF669 domain-containing protein [Clostridia bacterium]|nr:DUF669 domain-containing protein [Clostridia bacterium]
MNNQYETVNESRGLEWDDVIKNDGSDYEPMPEGDYDFVVTKFERSRSAGKGKLPPCNMAALTLRIESPERSSTVTDNLVLHTLLEWKISSFFRSIGQKKHGEELRPKWNEVVGARGRCHVYVDKYTGDNGKEYVSNKVDKYLDPEDVPAAPTAEPKRYW